MGKVCRGTRRGLKPQQQRKAQKARKDEERRRRRDVLSKAKGVAEAEMKSGFWKVRQIFGDVFAGTFLKDVMPLFTQLKHAKRLGAAQRVFRTFRMKRCCHVLDSWVAQVVAASQGKILGASSQPAPQSSDLDVCDGPSKTVEAPAANAFDKMWCGLRGGGFDRATEDVRSGGSATSGIAGSDSEGSWVVVSEAPYFEEQEACYCAKHAVNHALQVEEFKINDFFERFVSEAEAEINSAFRQSQELAGEGHKVEYTPEDLCDGLGNFRAPVVMVALRSVGFKLENMSPEERAAGLENLRAMIVHEGSHWFCIRKIGDDWWRLDSNDHVNRGTKILEADLQKSLRTATAQIVFKVTGDWDSWDSKLPQRRARQARRQISAQISPKEAIKPTAPQELMCFLKAAGLEKYSEIMYEKQRGGVEALLEMEEPECAQMEKSCSFQDIDKGKLMDLVAQERNRRETEPSVGAKIAAQLKTATADSDSTYIYLFEQRHSEPNDIPLPEGTSNHSPIRCVRRLFEAQVPEAFVDHSVHKEVTILLSGSRADKLEHMDTMLNYIFGTKWQELHRFKGIPDLHQGGEADIVISAYKIPAVAGGRVQSRVTFMDYDLRTPNASKARASQVAEQVELFFRTYPQHVPSALTGVCCVVPTPTGLSQSQKQEQDAVLDLFPKSINKNTVLCCKTADGKPPEVAEIDAIGVLHRSSWHFHHPSDEASARGQKWWSRNEKKMKLLFDELCGFSPVKLRGRAQKDDDMQARQQLLDDLEADPAAAPAEKEVRQQMKAFPEDAKRWVAIGGTGVGKSATLSLLEGSLDFDFESKQWKSGFKLGNTSEAGTEKPEIRRSEEDIFADTPGPGDGRGQEKDREHMHLTAQMLNGMDRIDMLLLVVDARTRIPRGVRETLQFLQAAFGTEMWQHTVVCVNWWRLDQDSEDQRSMGMLQTTDEFKNDFLGMLQKPLRPDDEKDEYQGLGLSEGQCSKIRFAFFNTHYDRRKTGEGSEAARVEAVFCQLRREAAVSLGWRAGVRSQSPELRSLADAVRSTDTAEELKQCYDTVKRMPDKPKDVTDAKLEKVLNEIQRRSVRDSAQAADAALLSFIGKGGENSAREFLNQFEALKRKDASKLSALKPYKQVLEAALQGQPPCYDQFPDASLLLKDQVNKLCKHAKACAQTRKALDEILAQWSIVENGEVMNALTMWAQKQGIQSEADLARQIKDCESIKGKLTPVGRTRLQNLLNWHMYQHSSSGKSLSQKVQDLQKLLQEAQDASKTRLAEIKKALDAERKALDKEQKALEEAKEAERIHVEWRSVDVQHLNRIGSDEGSRARDDMIYCDCELKGDELYLGHSPGGAFGSKFIVVKKGKNVKQATGCKTVWKDEKGKGKKDYVIVIPTCDDQDFRALGVVCNFGVGGHEEPGIKVMEKMALIRKDCLERVDHGRYVWRDAGTRARWDVTLNFVDALGTMWPSVATFWSPGDAHKIKDLALKEMKK